MKATNKHKQLKLSGSNFAIPLAATIGLFAGGAAFLNPLSFIDNSYADSTSADISVNIGEVIMVPEVSQEAINLDLDPDVNGDFASDTVNVRVSTNHVSGYTLTMSTEGAETALTSEDFDNYQIDTLGSKTSATNFADLTHTDSINKWGYATDNNGDGEGQTEADYYYGITNKDNPTTIKITDAPTNSSETNVTFATKGKDLAAGTYSNTVVFSAVANAIPEPATLDEAQEKGYTMQQITADMCANTTEYSTSNITYTFADSRDDNEYQIRKLADGNCWMVSNLAITNTMISPADSDLDDDSFTIPASSTDYSDSEGFMHIVNNNDVFNTEHPGYNPNSDTTTYSPLYGPYYNWYTATAGTGSITNDNPTSSICPKRWKLPSSTAGDYSWGHLYNTGYNSNVTDFQAATNTGVTHWGGFYYNYISNKHEIAYASNSGYWLTREAHIYHGEIAYIHTLKTEDNLVDNSYYLEYGSLTGSSAIRCVLATE